MLGYKNRFAHAFDAIFRPYKVQSRINNELYSRNSDLRKELKDKDFQLRKELGQLTMMENLGEYVEGLKYRASFISVNELTKRRLDMDMMDLNHGDSEIKTYNGIGIVVNSAVVDGGFVAVYDDSPM